MRISWILPAWGLVLLAAPGCAPGEATASDPAAGPGFVEARSGTLEDRIVLSGELQAVRSEKIVVPRTPVWQSPIRWMEMDGATVARGQTVLELDNTAFTGDLAQKQLAESRAANDLAQKDADIAVVLAEKTFALEERRVTVDKAKIEAEIPSAIRPERQWQEAQLALARAESERRKAERDLETAALAAEAELEELRIGLARAREEVGIAEQAIEVLNVVAPRDGILVVAENTREGRKYQLGDTVWVGLAVMDIPDLSSMKVVARLSDVDDGRIAAGMRADCVLDILPDRSFGGVVTEIAPVAQEEGEQSLRRSFRAEILLDESEPAVMRPGMSVRVEVRPPAIEAAVVVPRAALEWEGDAPSVRLDDGTRVAVRLGRCNVRECVVEEGLAPGARLSGGGA